MSPWRDGPAGYGLISIGLHWVSAVAVLAMLFIGNSIDASAAGSSHALRLHTGLGLACYPLLWFRVWWRVRQRHPPAPRQIRLYVVMGEILHYALLAALAVMLLSGPVLALAGGYGIAVADRVTLTSPWGTSAGLSGAMHGLHIVAASIIGYGTLLHLCGVLKHVLFDKDGTLDRMLVAHADRR